MSDVRLHIPDEPVVRLAVWRARIVDGTTHEEVMSGDDGVIAWYWSRWQVLDRLGVDRAAFSRVAQGYRRELLLWLRGERTHVATASGLLGRTMRRLPADEALELRLAS